MAEISSLSTFSPDIPHYDSWPYIRAYSARSMVYYQPSEEASLPIYDERFWSLVGREIKVLGHILIKQGCHFIPQSEGQSLSREDLKDAWNTLKSEEKAIRKDGLSLTNFETGDKIEAKDAAYKIPWPTFEDFESNIKQKAQAGCVFVLIPTDMKGLIAEIKDFASDSSYSKIEVLYDEIQAADANGNVKAFGLLRILVDCSYPEDRLKEWKDITNFVFKCFSKAKDTSL